MAGQGTLSIFGESLKLALTHTLSAIRIGWPAPFFFAIALWLITGGFAESHTAPTDIRSAIVPFLLPLMFLFLGAFFYAPVYRNVMASVVTNKPLPKGWLAYRLGLDDFNVASVATITGILGAVWSIAAFLPAILSASAERWAAVRAELEIIQTGGGEIAIFGDQIESMVAWLDEFIKLTPGPIGMGLFLVLGFLLSGWFLQRISYALPIASLEGRTFPWPRSFMLARSGFFTVLSTHVLVALVVMILVVFILPVMTIVASVPFIVLTATTTPMIGYMAFMAVLSPLAFFGMNLVAASGGLLYRRIAHDG